MKIKLGGAKNTTLQLLTDGFLIVSNVPNLADNQTMSLLLELQGEAVEPVTNDGFKLPFAGSISDTETPYKLIRGHVPGAGISARVDERGPRVAVRRLYRHAR